MFTWDDPKLGFHPISFYLGGEAKVLKKEIKKLELINERLINLKKHKYNVIISTFDEYDKQGGHFTQKAKEIRENYLPGIFDPTNFNKSDFKRIVNRVKSNIQSFILNDKEREITKKEAEADNRYESLNEKYSVQQDIERLAHEVKTILEDSVQKSISIHELENDSQFFNWVQEGLKYHHNAENCKFCNQPLSQDKIALLNASYSDKLKAIQVAIAKTQKTIHDEKKKISVQFPDSKNIAEPFRNDFVLAIKAFNTKRELYLSQLELLEADLKIKESNIFGSIPSKKLDLIKLDETFQEVEGIIKNHNVWLSQFSSRKKKAIVTILNHFVSEYLISENYTKKEKEMECAKRIISKINIKHLNNDRLIKDYKQKLNNTLKGQEAINEILEILLHRSDIKIEIRDDNFRLERSGHPAIHLSEGEKSAIAFAYFLTDLKSLRFDYPPKLPQTIIFIDDPISSLDSNHIFQVRSLLKDFFNSDDFTQLFISTHNFDFFLFSTILEFLVNNISEKIYVHYISLSV